MSKVTQIIAWVIAAVEAVVLFIQNNPFPGV